MAHVIATINLKGGVGKTTTTVALAKMLSGEFHKRVLVIDLDPQTNATVMLIGEKKWKELNAKGLTLARLFQDAVKDQQQFDLPNTLQKSVSNVSGVNTVDLLPSSLDLIDIQDLLASAPAGRFYSNNPTDLLRRATRPVIDSYDYVLIDCPPNLGIITLNGLRMSNGYIIPTIPDILSTYGIPQIVKRVGDFATSIGEVIKPIGIVVTKFRSNVKMHQDISLRLGKDAPVFKTIIPESAQIAGAAEFLSADSRSTLRQKYGYAGQFDAYRNLASEFKERVDA